MDALATLETSCDPCRLLLASAPLSNHAGRWEQTPMTEGLSPCRLGLTHDVHTVTQECWNYGACDWHAGWTYADRAFSLLQALGCLA